MPKQRVLIGWNPATDVIWQYRKTLDPENRAIFDELEAGSQRYLANTRMTKDDNGKFVRR